MIQKLIIQTGMKKVLRYIEKITLPVGQLLKAFIAYRLMWVVCSQPIEPSWFLSYKQPLSLQEPN